MLILRPEPGASATLERALALGLDALVIPLFSVEPVDWQPPDPSGFDGLLVTSAKAIHQSGAGLAELRDIPVYAVGEATAAAARAHGLTVAAIGDAGVDALLATIPPSYRLLHLAGEDRFAPTGAEQSITALTVYRARERENVDLGQAGDCVALVHSARAARRLAALAPKRSAIAIAAISAAAAEAAGAGWADIAIAEAPNDEALLALAARLCNSSGL